MRLVGHMGIDDCFWRYGLNDHVAERVPGTVRHQSTHPELVAHTRHVSHLREPDRPARQSVVAGYVEPAGHVRDLTMSPSPRGGIARAG